MGYILIAGVVGMLFGFALGVLAMALFAASQPDERLASPPDVHEPSLGWDRREPDSVHHK